MYRFFSLLNSLIVVVFSGLSFFYYNDDFGWEIPFFSDIIFYTSIALLFGLIIKAQIRWQKLLLTIKLDGFGVTVSGWKKSLINEYLAYFLYLPISILLLFFIAEAKMVSVLLFGFLLEGTVHLIIGRKKYKLVINEQSVIILRNKQYIILWDRVKTVAFKYQGIIIFEKTGRHNYISEADFEEAKKWKKLLKEISIKKDIYVEN